MSTFKDALQVVIGAAVFGVAVAIMAFLLAPHASAKDFSAGFGVGNAACGSAEPTASIVYDDDSDGLPMHFRLGVGPNGSCSGQGVSVDVLVEGRRYVNDRYYGVVGAGYDLRTVPFEYDATAWGTKQFRGEGVETVQAMFGMGMDTGSGFVQATYNVVENALADTLDDNGVVEDKGGNLFPVSITAGWQLLDEQLELNATTNFDTAAISADARHGNIVVGVSASFGFHKLDNPAQPFLVGRDVKYERQDPPSPLYSVDLRWDF